MADQNKETQDNAPAEPRTMWQHTRDVEAVNGPGGLTIGHNAEHRARSEQAAAHAAARAEIATRQTADAAKPPNKRRTEIERLEDRVRDLELRLDALTGGRRT